ncbi:MAG: TetR/AcrR family transcriptional regulator [Peptococcaceae bacterium]|nr:TetR/AcrR family transcriptional regulator [Peptococcaceae bacterium]
MSAKTNTTSQSQRILDAAIKCIAKKGYANASLRDIAGEAGVVLSQLNYYYKNKEGLFIEVVKMLSQQYLNEIENILKSGETEKEKTAALTRYFQRMLKEDSELLTLLFDLSSMALWSDSLRELLSNFFHDVAKLIEKHILEDVWHKGKLKKYPTAVSRIMLGAMLGTSIQAVLAENREDILHSLEAIQVVFA